MKRRNLMILSLTSLLGLAACGTGGNGNYDQPLPAGDPPSQVTIEFWHCLGHAKTENLEKVIKQFNDKYAGKYYLNATHPAGDYGDLHDVVKTKMASGEVPAITMGYPDSFSEYMTADINESFILKLDTWLKDSEAGYSKDEINDFVPGYYNEGTQYQFTGTWSMPMYKSTEVMYYNLSYFMGVNPLNAKRHENDPAFMALYNEAVGRTIEKDTEGTLVADLQAVKNWLVEHDGTSAYVYEVPETWDQAIILARKMVADRKAAGVTGEFYPFGYDSDANLLISQMAQRNIPYTANDEASKNNPAAHIKFNNAEAKQLVTDIVGYLKEKIMITKNSLGGTTYTNEYFNEGKCAFTVGSTGGSSYNISSNFAVKLAPVPYKNQRKYIQQGPSFCFFDNGNKWIHKGAWLFFKEFADPANNAQIALENSYDPVRISSYSTTKYAEWISHAGEGLKYDIPAMTATLKDYYITSPVFVGSSTCRDEIGNIISYVYSSNYSVNQAFSEAYDNCVNAVK